MPAQMIPPTKSELMAFIDTMNEANEEAMRALLSNPEFKALSENEQAEASTQALLFAYFTEQRFKDEADEEDDDEDNESVHSTCCMDCDESFQFEEPVPAADYHEGRHEMRCPECRGGAPEKFAGEND